MSQLRDPYPDAARFCVPLRQAIASGDRPIARSPFEPWGAGVGRGRAARARCIAHLAVGRGRGRPDRRRHPEQRPVTDQVCSHCGAALAAGAAFRQVCGTATSALAALARHPAPAPVPQAARTAAIALSGVTNAPEPYRPAPHGRALAAASAAARGGQNRLSPIEFPSRVPGSRMWPSRSGRRGDRHRQRHLADPGAGLDGSQTAVRTGSRSTMPKPPRLSRWRVEPAGGTDTVAELEAAINRLTSTPTTGLTSKPPSTAPPTYPLRRAPFPFSVCSTNC